MGFRFLPIVSRGNRAMPLTMLPAGSSARVTAVYGGRGFNRRLASMGIFPGVELALVKGGVGGPVIVDVRGSRFILGHGMARRIMVRPFS